MMRSSDRAFLRGLANELEPILHIGKEGVTENVLAQADEALTARELIKGTVQQNCEFSAREATEILCDELSADPVAVVGRRFVIFRRNIKEPKIVFPK